MEFHIVSKQTHFDHFEFLADSEGMKESDNPLDICDNEW